MAMLLMTADRLFGMTNPLKRNTYNKSRKYRNDFNYEFIISNFTKIKNPKNKSRLGAHGSHHKLQHTNISNEQPLLLVLLLNGHLYHHVCLAWTYKTTTMARPCMSNICTQPRNDKAHQVRLGFK